MSAARQDMPDLMHDSWLYLDLSQTKRFNPLARILRVCSASDMAYIRAQCGLHKIRDIQAIWANGMSCGRPAQLRDLDVTTPRRLIMVQLLLGVRKISSRECDLLVEAIGEKESEMGHSTGCSFTPR